MEDGACDLSIINSETEDNVKNGAVPSVMTNFSEGTNSTIEETSDVLRDSKFNGDSNIESNTCEDDISSESDALIIDESVPKKVSHKRKRSARNKGNKKTTKDSEVITHSNPFFNESLYELSQQHQKSQTDSTPSTTKKDQSDTKVINCKVHKHKKGKNKSPKREYAQYLGLQPTVQFKCSKCGQAGFETLIALNDHIVQCDAIPTNQQPTQDHSSSSFKLTRKVFLCSACGTYYENWNLYLHMLELHRRFICLYCLGMFSAPNDLCQHIQTRHNLQPGHKNSLDEFFNVYSEPCYVVCCECNKLFSEEDNFFYHNCIKSVHANNKTNQKLATKGKIPKVQIRPENHITGDSGSSPPKEVSTTDNYRNSVQSNIEYNDEVPKENTNHNSEAIEGLDLVKDNSLDGDVDIDKDNLDGIEKQSTGENMSVAMEISNNVDSLLYSDKLTLIEAADSKNGLDVKSESLSGKYSDEEERISLTEERQTGNTDNFDTTQLESNYIKNNTEEAESDKEFADTTQNIPFCAQQKLVEDLHSPISEGEENVNNISHENESRSEDPVEESVRFSDNDFDENDIFSDHDNISDSLMDGCEKIRPGSSQDEADMEESELELAASAIETRKVPKLSLKLPKSGVYSDKGQPNEDSDDSEKLTMEVELESENEGCAQSEMKMDDVGNCDTVVQQINEESTLLIAGSDVSIVELQLEQPLDKFDVRVLLQKCLKATAPFCVYCNHARKIAVNGKQLGLHAIAEHRYTAIVNSITAEELMPETFVARIKENLNELSNIFFNIESGATDEGVTFSHIFECFQCRYSTTIHKELYLHNRKLHTKNLLLCIMCKSNFYSYSELICHLCPGVYILNYDIQFRCCMCVSDDLPSAFRLMVHLRKRHHVCDVCLELCHNQYKLSNHVWKHKLHHFCYRCGIAYRNKPDITRHLFWKHGTESVLCKKCLQKKWPHVYHFCVPPTVFNCDECTLTFTKAVSLKVHKRIHSEEKPHACTVDDCTESFISRKLLLKHELKHREPEEEIKDEVVYGNNSPNQTSITAENGGNVIEAETEKTDTKIEEKPKLKVDVYDLPELNLSESDSESEEEDVNKNKAEEINNTSTNVVEPSTTNTETILNLNMLENGCEAAMLQEDNKVSLLDTEMEKPSDFDFEPSEKVPPILENIWDDFKNYQAEKEKIDHLFTDKDKIEDKLHEDFAVPLETVDKLSAEVVLLDHDYCFVSEPQVDTNITEVKPDLTQRVDHDYCSPKGHNAISSPTEIEVEKPLEEEQKTSPKKQTESTSSDSSSGSDSSSCTCGSNCSCSSSSGSSSSSSDSSDSDSSTEEGRRRQQLKRERRKERAKSKKTEIPKVHEIISVDHVPPVFAEVPIQESDLDTTESETDEEFYDKQPQKLAKRILEEKRNQLLAEVGPILKDTWLESSRPTTPNLPEEETKPKKKSKSKKKKKRRSERREHENQDYSTPSIPVSSYYQCYQPPSSVAPITLTISRNSPVPSQSSSISQATSGPKMGDSQATLRSDDSSLRASKRRRVPNKFYGYSSDEESERGPHPHVPKWRKGETQSLPQSPLTVPPLTIKTAQLNPQPAIEPLTIRPAAQTGELRVLPRPTAPVRLPLPKHFTPFVPTQHLQVQPPIDDSGSDSNESSAEENHKPPEKPVQPQLYCYCRCPYDEVSEMIGCDASDCAIEWFHFECVGIMVPPKGQWFCPDCRKKKQQRRELLQT